ncbi:MAG: hypothetical protein AMXMBFR42_21120 [Burkholderiales bacterium]
MPSLLTSLRSLALGLAACALVGATSAATHSVGVLLDTDDQGATGCPVATANGALTGIELVVTARIVTTATGAYVDRVDRQTCTGGSLGAPVVVDPGDWPVGLGAGAGGSAVVEWSIPRSLLPPSGVMKAVAVASDGAAGADATPSFLVTLRNGSSSAAVAVPLAPWTAIPLALAVAWLAVRFARRHPERARLAGILFVFAFAGLAWAASDVVRDGAIGDWAGVPPAVGDPTGDGAPNADIVAVFVQVDDTYLHLRIDADVRTDNGGTGNLAPIVSAGPGQTITLPAAATLSGSATDDGLPSPPGALSTAWTLDSGPPGAFASFANPASPTSSVSFNAPGTYVLRLTANDSALSASATTTVTVQDGAPQLASIADRTIELGTRLQIVLEAKDGNAGDALAYSLPAAPAGASLAPPPLLDWTPTSAQLGTHPFTVRVTDGAGASASRSFNVTVVHTNRPPTIAPQTNEVVRGGATFVRRIVASDPDLGDTLTFSLVAGPPGMTISGNELRWPTAGASAGDRTVTVRVRDVAGLTDQTSFTLTLLPAAAPVAVDDAYEVRVGETLVVPAPGVLANDQNPSGGPVSAVKKTDPALGTLSAFDANGAFTFVAPSSVPAPAFGLAEAWRNDASGQIVNTFPVVGDVNGDGYPDLVLSSQFVGHRAVDLRTGATLWDIDRTGYADCGFGFATTTAPALADVDDDGVPEYIGNLGSCERDSNILAAGYAPADRIFALDGRTGAVKWMSERVSRPLGDVLAPGAPPSTEDRFQHVYAGAQYASMHVARLAPGAAPTILFRQTLRADAGYYQPVSGPARSTGCRALTGLAADDNVACRATILMRGDGTIESILTAPNPSNLSQASWDPTRELAPFTVDVDGDGAPEIVSGSDVWKNVGGAWTLLWQSEIEPIQALAADLDGDGRPEIVHVLAMDKTGSGASPRGQYGGDLYKFNGLLILDGATGAEKRRIRLPTYWTSWLTIADLDGDGAPEFVWNTQGRVYAIGAEGRIRWTYAFIPGHIGIDPGAYSGTANVQVYDLDGDGVPEVVTNSHSEIVVLNGRTGAVRASHPSSGLHGGYYTGHDVQLVDADADGHVDIVATNVSGPDRLSYLMLRGAPNDWLPGPAIHPQVNFANGDFSGNGHAELNANVPVQFRNPAQQGTVGDPRETEGTSFTYAIDDGAGESAPATVFVKIAPANRPPVITSTPPSGLLQRFAPTPPGGLVTNYYQPTAIDPDAGDTLTWSLVSAPAWVTMEAGGRIRFEPTCGSYGYPCGWGWTFVVLRVTDSLGAYAEQSFMVNLTTTGAAVPNVVGLMLADANAAVVAAALDPQLLQEVADASPAGTVLAQDPVAGAPNIAQGAAVFLTVSKGPQPVAVPFVVGKTLAQANAAIGALGLTTSVSTVFSPTVPAGDVLAQSPDFGTMLLPGSAPPVALTVSAGAPLAKPVAQVVVEPGPGPLARLAGETQAFKATAVFDDGTSANVTYAATWLSSAPAIASVDATGVALAKTAGGATVSATIGGRTGQATIAVSALAPGDATPPVAAIDAPADGASVNGPVDVTGTATDPNFLRYELAFALAGDEAWTVIGEGTSPVAGGVLGTFDPTVLVNDLYTLRLRVFDRGENVTETSATVQAKGQRKIGLFTLTFIDLQVPMAGLPITVSRTYDSRDKAKGDFGVGWRLGLQTLRLRANRVLGTGWLRTVSGPTVSLSPTAEHKISVTLPDGRIEEFDMVVSPTANIGSLDFTTVTGFVARPGTLGALEVLGNRDLIILDDGAATVLVDDTTLEYYDPTRFRYTAANGTVIEIHRADGVTRMTDTNGNTLVFGPEGITHSSGKSVAFTRDVQGRITQIVDPLGHVQTYAYDANGDLASRTDATGRTSSYLYDRAHNLIEALDPSGNRAIRNDYDAGGRLVSMTDANGATVTYTHDLGASREIVRDRLGWPTVYDYDADGNLVARTDALGGLWTTTFDARGNPLVRTDPLGRTLVRTYDARDNVLTETDEDGNLRTWTYDAQGRVLVATDPEGRITTHTYDVSGNLVRVDDPEGGVTRHAYDGAGNRTSSTDPLGRVTLFGHDGSGNLVSTTDPLGNTTSYAYDAANRRVSLTDPLGGTTLRIHDAAGRVVKVVDPMGNGTTIAYGAVGDGSRPTSRTDPLGRTTTWEYDALARRVKTTNPDGTTELTGYDAEGRVVSSTDRAGATTAFLRDALGRTTRTTFADGTTRETTYDAAGRQTSSTDERGNATTFGYAPGQLSVTDPLGRTTTRDLDGSLRPIRITNPLGRIWQYAYDSAGNLLATTYPDGSTASTAYDAAGQPVARTDQAGRVVHRAYDDAGRLASVTDPEGGITTYDYDAAGRRTRHRDANGHTTSYGYDAAGRLLTLTRPGGQQEERTYDAAGNLVSRTDFGGRVTTYVHDSMNRVVRKVLPGGAVTTYAYDPAGRRTSAGGDSYVYDVRGRLVRETKAGGDVLDYTRDAAGNVTLFGSPHGTTSYTYDALGRLATVAAASGVTTYAYDEIGNLAGVTRPNGVTTTYGHDALDRLVSLAHAGPGGPIAAYVYTLGPAGHRTRVDESGPATTGRTVRYTYDAADRLTREQIEEPGLPAYAIDYTYDAAGNRTKMVRGGTATDYAYDADDRLVSRVTGAATVSYGWDANGNLASRTAGAVVDTYFHDGEDRLTAVSGPSGTVGYAYDADGIRISRSAGGVTTAYLVDKALPASRCPCGPDLPGAMAQVVAETTAATTVSYTYGHALLERTEVGAGTHAYLRDAQHSVRQLTTAAGDVSDRYTYDAFGVELASVGSTPNPYRYAGEAFDPVVGLQYHRARYYDPSIGRFTSTDPVAGDIEDPSTLHRYLYAAGDPVGRIDPTGRENLLTLTLTQAAWASAAVGIGTTFGTKALGIANDWGQAATLGAVAAAGTFAVFFPSALAASQELAGVEAGNLAIPLKQGLKYVGQQLFAAATESGATAQMHLGIARTAATTFIRNSFRTQTARCFVANSLSAIVVGYASRRMLLEAAGGFQQVSLLSKDLPQISAQAEAIVVGVKQALGCP